MLLDSEVRALPIVFEFAHKIGKQMGMMCGKQEALQIPRLESLFYML